MNIILGETEIVKILRDHVQKTRGVTVDGARFEVFVKGLFASKTIVGCQFSENYEELTRNGEYTTSDPQTAPKRFYAVLHAVEKGKS